MSRNVNCGGALFNPTSLALLNMPNLVHTPTCHATSFPPGHSPTSYPRPTDQSQRHCKPAPLRAVHASPPGPRPPARPAGPACQPLPLLFWLLHLPSCCCWHPPRCWPRCGSRCWMPRPRCEQHAGRLPRIQSVAALPRRRAGPGPPPPAAPAVPAAAGSGAARCRRAGTALPRAPAAALQGTAELVR